MRQLFLVVLVTVTGCTQRSTELNQPSSGSASLKYSSASATARQSDPHIEKFISKGRRLERRTGEIIVHYNPSAQKIQHQAIRARRDLGDDVEIISYDPALTFDGAVAQFGAARGVADVEANLRIRAQGAPISVAPRLALDLRREQKYLGRVRADRGSVPRVTTVHIGLIDTGVDLEHPDLQGHLGKGVNLVYPRQRADITSSPAPAEALDPSEMDYNGHGSGMAGLIAAAHNDFGIDGIATGAVVHGIKAFDLNGIGYLADIAAGLGWAIQHHMDIIEMSFGTYEDSPLVRKVVSKARARGILLIGAAGNDANEQVMYPAAYPGVVAIGSLGDTGQVSKFSNWGPRVDLFFPGEHLLTTTASKTEFTPYGALSGTSCAAAYAVGVVSLLIEAGQRAPHALENLLQSVIIRNNTQGPYHGPVKEANIEKVVASVTGRAYANIELMSALGPSSVSPRAPVDVAFSVENTGNAPSSPCEVSCELSTDANDRMTSSIAVPALAPGASYNASCSVVANDPNARQFLVTLRASDSSSDSVSGAISDSPAQRARVEALWVSPADITDPEVPKTLHVRVTNTGSIALPAGEVTGFVTPGSHEALGLVPPMPITDIAALPPLAPRDSVIILLPIEAPLPSARSITFDAAVKIDGAVVAAGSQAIHVSPSGTAMPLYAEGVHQGQALQVIDLLRRQGIYIDELMGNQNFVGTEGVWNPDLPSNSSIIIWGSNFAWRWDSSKCPPGGVYHQTYGQDWTNYMLWARTLLDGAYAADHADIAYSQNGTEMWDTHYWRVDDGDQAGEMYNEDTGKSAFTKIEDLMLGLQRPCSDNFEGSIQAYKNGDKPKSLWTLGHIIHLMGDISTGAHTINVNSHGFIGDAYHDWMGTNDSSFGPHGKFRVFGPGLALTKGGMINPYNDGLVVQNQLTDTYSRVRFLAFTTAQIASSFAWRNTHKNDPADWAATAEAPVKLQNDFGSGNYTLAGALPHYDAYMNVQFSSYWHHPVYQADLTAVESCYYNGYPSVCDLNGDGHWEDDNTAEAYEDGTYGGHFADSDGDLTNIASTAYVYSMRAAAGIVYLWAMESGVPVKLYPLDSAGNPTGVAMPIVSKSQANGNVNLATWATVNF
jgi:hypothetical protein